MNVGPGPPGESPPPARDHCDLSPLWFLQAEGCVVRPGMFVKGTAFRDPTQASAGLDYAMSVMANGEVCALRDNHLNGLWADAGGMDAEER